MTDRREGLVDRQPEEGFALRHREGRSDDGKDDQDGNQQQQRPDNHRASNAGGLPDVLLR